jgi:hypothetical protein
MAQNDATRNGVILSDDCKIVGWRKHEVTAAGWNGWRHEEAQS